MTIFEMLEKLETEILSLQARCQDLANSVQHPAANTNGHTGPKQQRTRRTLKKKATKKRATKKPSASKAAPEFAQLELPVSETAGPAEPQPARVLGKRQALGKSLVQLRKMSAWRTARDGEE